MFTLALYLDAILSQLSNHVVTIDLDAQLRGKNFRCIIPRWKCLLCQKDVLVLRQDFIAKVQLNV